MPAHKLQIFTIGHSTHSLDNFINLLQVVKISAIADVRSAPYSRHQPHFNREALRSSLKKAEMSYAFLGRELGGRGVGPSVRDQYGRVRYERIANMDLFREGLKRLREGAERMPIALMCTEGEPLNCHRAILISRHLAEDGMEVAHIHADGNLEFHCDAEDRLLRLTGLHQPEMFRTRSQILEEAYQRQEERIAYVAPRTEIHESILS
ncbi:DUF488 domain-containing protein [Micromonospora sp. WMMD975]|uniref:DUF488 domain-containing protein n=1 Tax=Micromonospora sp. WMMD975 TaxID=3016087 RepID=UPI00249C8081|nr:DUF488 domain-containing protein [Micromonospora sp. WMMD975]WFE31753.1 DUF488 domain-containing protein [Micromonospora sp. WMMD975]